MRALVALLLVLPALAVLPTASAQTCLFGYNPDSLTNACYDTQQERRPLYTYTVTTTDGTCVIGNLCPGIESSPSGSYLHPIVSVYVEATFLCDDPKIRTCGWTVTNDFEITAE